MTDPRIPVLVLTGFLGSGKTTLLRHLLRHPAFADAAVLINEFGEIGLDHMLLGALSAEPVLMASGCICCSIRGDLSAALRDLHARRQEGTVPRFSRVVVETTGLADPTPILATIASDRVLRHHYRPGLVVATLDGLHANDGLARHPELLRQAAIADRLIITKTDLAAPETVARLREQLAALNPQASLALADHGMTDLDALLAPGDARHWFEVAPDTVRRHGAVRSFCITAEAPLAWSVFGIWLSLLVHRHGSRILRLKGLLLVAGSETPVALHAVQHVIHPPEHLPAWPSGERHTRLVFIVDGLEPDAVRRSFESFSRLAARLVGDSQKNNP